MRKVTIITASYNYENYIKETIESLQAQTIKDWEMIIVDDGSKDNSVEVIKSYSEKDNRIRFYQHPNGENKGLIETIKLGIEKANGEWIVFLESDDTIIPTYLEEKLRIIEQHPDVEFIFNDVNMFGDIKRIKKYNNYFIKQKKILNSLEYPTRLLQEFDKFNNNLIPTFSVVMLKKELLNNLSFNSPIKACLDYYIWLQLLLTTKFYYLDKTLTNWRIHKDSYVNEVTSPIDSLRFEIFKGKKFNNSENILQAVIRRFKPILVILRKGFFNIYSSKGCIVFLWKVYRYGRVIND